MLAASILEFIPGRHWQARRSAEMGTAKFLHFFRWLSGLFDVTCRGNFSPEPQNDESHQFLRPDGHKNFHVCPYGKSHRYQTIQIRS